MSEKSDTNTIRELTKAVLALESRMVSLEKLVLEQSSLLKNLVRDREVSCSDMEQSARHELDGGKETVAADNVQIARPPIREARIRAASALIAGARKTRGVGAERKISSSLSTHQSSSRATKPSAQSSHSGPPTPTAPALTPATPPPPSPPLSLSLQIPAAINAPKQTAANNVLQNNDWVEVTHRRPRRTPTDVTRGTATPGSAACSLSAAERKSYLHLYFVKIGTTAEQVIAHLETICGGDKCFAEALKARGDYSSFKLTVPTKNIEEYMKPEHWSEDVHIKPWRSRFRNSQQQAGQ